MSVALAMREVVFEFLDQDVEVDDRDLVRNGATLKLSVDGAVLEGELIIDSP